MHTRNLKPTLLRSSKMRPFKNFVSALGLSMLAVSSGSAQIVAYDDEQPKLTLGAVPGTLDMNWFGHSGRVYFIKVSPTLDTGSWAYLPYIERGTNVTLSFGTNTPRAGDRFFARTVITASASTQPRFADFDNDGVSNMDELQAGLDPLSSENIDSDGMPDDWERFYLGDLSRDGTGDFDGDGMSDADEYAAGRHPNTSVVFAGTEFKWAGEDTVNQVVYLADNQFESTLAVTYTDTAQTKVATMKLYLDNSYNEFLYSVWDPIDYPEPTPSVEYAVTADTDGAHSLLFASHSVVSPSGDHIGRDLLRKIDGKPYTRAGGTSPVKRVASYIAVTSLPLISVNVSSFPAILRDFPYGNPLYPDFANGHEDGSTGMIAENLGSDGLPVFAHNDINTSRHIRSTASFAPWFRAPSALSFGLSSEIGYSLPSGYVSGFSDESFHPHANDVGPTYGKYCFTLEFHGRLAYDLSKTKFKFSSDDDLWVFINGKLIWDKGGIHSGGEETKFLSELPHNLVDSTGTANIDVFYSERRRAGAELRLVCNSVITPFYTYQVIAEGLDNGPLSPSFALITKPSGMTISSSGKILWDYSGVNSGNYPVTVEVTNANGTGDTQSFTIVVNNAPVFVTQPVSQWAYAGDTATLSASALGSPTFQWYRGTTILVGMTLPTLTLTNVQAVDAGDYTVKATNSSGTVTSSTATLEVY